MIGWAVLSVLMVCILGTVGWTIYDYGYAKAYWERTEQIDRLLGLRTPEWGGDMPDTGSDLRR